MNKRKHLNLPDYGIALHFLRVYDLVSTWISMESIYIESIDSYIDCILFFSEIRRTSLTNYMCNRIDYIETALQRPVREMSWRYPVPNKMKTENLVR